MKKMRLLIRGICVLLLLAIVFTVAAYTVVIKKDGKKWGNRPNNGRLTEARQSVIEGSIIDSAGVVLAESSAPGERHYIENDDVRFALSHTIGDTKAQCANGVENRQATVLLGMSDLTRNDYMVQTLMGSTPAGNDIHLTVSAELSTYMASLFPAGHNGAAVLLNYETGAILGKVSLPGYDVADIDIKRDEWLGRSYFDRTLTLPNAPGSAFKIIVLDSALENLNGCAFEDYECAGEWSISDYTIHCAGSTAHGEMSLMDAFANSCNVTFSNLAYRLGAARLMDTANRFGFNQTFVFSDFVLQASKCLAGKPTSGETLQAGIGQGETTMTPLHMAMISGAIANGGVMMEPHIIGSVSRYNGETLTETVPSELMTVCDPETAETIAKYMYAVVDHGTGTRAKISGYSGGHVCGKTGSAEFGTTKSDSTHAWYTGFLYGDAEHPYAIAVFVEGGGSGGAVAAPMASKMMAKAISMGLY